MLQGWKRYRDYPDPRVRERFAREMKKVSSAYTAALWAMEKRFRRINRAVSDEIRQLRREIDKEFGILARLSSHFLGPVLWWTSHRKDQRLSAGKTYEPPTIIERTNWAQSEPHS